MRTAPSIVALAALVLAATAGCTPAAAPSASAGSGASSEVRAYVDEALAAMAEGIRTDDPEWAEAVAEKKPRLYAAATIPDTYETLANLIHVAGGPHSRFFAPDTLAAMDESYDEEEEFDVPAATTSDGITVLVLPGFIGQTREAMQTYRDAGVGAVDAARATTTCGWVVDLRDDWGGNFWPMLATIAPFLGDGHVFGRQDVAGEIVWTDLEDGAAIGDEVWDEGRFDGAGFTVDQPVVLVVGDDTASAGELVVISFAGRDGAAVVGEATEGFTTANDWLELSDGSVVNITNGWDVDRTGRIYDGPIEPDVAVADDAAPDALAVATSRLAAECG